MGLNGNHISFVDDDPRLSLPKEIYFDPRIVFTLCLGCQSTPYVMPFHPDTLDTDLAAAAKNFCESITLESGLLQVPLNLKEYFMLRDQQKEFLLVGDAVLSHLVETGFLSL